MAANPFADATVASLLDAVAARWPDREAIVFGEERITFGRFRERADRLPNRPAWFFAQHACARLGAVVVALNPRYKAHELGYILGQSDVAALLLTDHLVLGRAHVCTP